MIKFKHHDDMFKRFPRTLMNAFPEAPQWQDKAPLSDRVVIYLGYFVAGYMLALLTMGY